LGGFVQPLHGILLCAAIAGGWRQVALTAAITTSSSHILQPFYVRGRACKIIARGRVRRGTSITHLDGLTVARTTVSSSRIVTSNPPGTPDRCLI
jgi:hypothetical protein